jgi:hypothetical protein
MFVPFSSMDTAEPIVILRLDYALGSLVYELDDLLAS